MDAEERKQFEVIKSRVLCDKQFTCINSAVENLCQGKYNAELDILECMEKTAAPCKFARTFGCTLVCICPLRKFIAKNFDKWTVESTAVLRATAK